MDIDFDDFTSYSTDTSSVALIPNLQKAWISERSAPDILPYETRLLETISTRLKEQVRIRVPAPMTLRPLSHYRLPLHPNRIPFLESAIGAGGQL
jgi:hypothetical protein